MNNTYFIKEGYQCNLEGDNKPVRSYKEPPSSKVYQVPVYMYALNRIKDLRKARVIEFGSGSGYKLNKYIYPVADRVVGLDQKIAIDASKKDYPNLEWIIDDFSIPPNTVPPEKFDVIICADVIEHIVEPDHLLQRIKSYSDKETLIILSTPERDLVRGKESFGPPANKLHIREWSKVEFASYLEHNQLVILEHVLLPPKKVSFLSKLFKPTPINTCQMAVCKIA